MARRFLTSQNERSEKAIGHDEANEEGYMTNVSPLAPKVFPELPPVAGVQLATCAAGIRYTGRVDLLLAAFDVETTVAGVLTKSKTASSPIDWCRKSLVGGRAEGLVVNTGNANAFTGSAGYQAVEASVDAVADALACRPSRVFAASTGVIGETLAFDKIVTALAGLATDLKPSKTDGLWRQAAQAIMTTDTFAKGAGCTVRIGDAEVAISGIAKGSGMIAPDMATMLSFIFTDAALSAEVLQPILAAAADRTFNSITVDSDTSTSDTVLLFATGMAEGQPQITAADDPRLAEFKAGLEALMADLAQQIVRDGEGARKFIAITVDGAENYLAAKRIGLSIANSPLVKTAIAGEDPNWGRIVMAVGKAGEHADRDRLSIAIGGVEIARSGVAVDGYNEVPVALHMKGTEIDITVDVGIGDGRATVWTCDLTHGYITINADYRS